VQLNVQVAVGQRSYSAGLANVDFKRLRSATMDVKLPASGLGASAAQVEPRGRGRLTRPDSRRPGSNGVIKPLSVRWPDAQGRFSLVLPHLARGTILRFLGEQFRDVLHR
jgi:hypothetical protein